MPPSDLLTVFDGDDTLWFVEPLYDNARIAAGQVVASLGLDPAAWEEHERRIDLENVKSMGVSALRFPTSCVQAYEYLAMCSERATEQIAIERIWEAASKVFSEIAPVAPGAASVLAEVKSLGRVALLTKGDQTIQMQRLAQSGLTPYFDAVFVVPDKTEHEFRSVLLQMECNAGSSWSVGNSLASDINPALRVGMRCVWIDAHVWEHEKRDSRAEDGVLVEVASLLDVPMIIRNG